MTSRPPIRRAEDGRYEVELSDEERALLLDLPGHMREVFSEGDDPALERLFPVAYPEDPDRQTEYRLLVHDELMQSHMGTLQVLEDTVSDRRLSEDQLVAWLRAINQVRLLMGVRLEVTEDGGERPTSLDDPRAPAFAVYDYLSALQDEIVDALAGDGDGADAGQTEA